jgi:dienelactone hydrolase
MTVVAIMLVMLAANTARQLTGFALPADTPEDRRAQLAAHWRFAQPDGPGPHPALVLLSGCDGVRDNMDRWAEDAVAMGFATLIVDSHGPRGLEDFAAWRLVCAGQQLTGAERAGDLAVALAHLRAQPGVDPTRLAVLGASHGGWTVLDFLTLSDGTDPPPGLTAWPNGGVGAARDGVRAAITLYPYCGAGSRAGTHGWNWSGPVTMILVDGDTVTGDGRCRSLARRMARIGLPVALTVIAGVTHGFDQMERSALSPLRFDADATAQTAAIIRAVLDDVAARR